MDYLNEITKKLNLKKSVFLTGGAGVGKTTMTREVISAFEADAKKVAKLASTGMAATLIGGQTLHSFFDLGIVSDIEELQERGKYDLKPKIKKLINSMHLIVIDEISMVSDTLFEMITLRLKQADYDGALLVVGDFLQLPPVVRGSKEVKFAFESPSWREFAFEKVELTHIYRTDDKEFIELLNNVRFGYIDEKIHNQLNAYIKVLPNELNHFTFLFGKNISASRYNKAQLEFIESEMFVKEAKECKRERYRAFYE